MYQYYQFPDTDIFFNYIGTTRIPLSQFRELAIPMVEAADAKISSAVEEWEAKHGPFELDGVHFLSGPDATRADLALAEVKGMPITPSKASGKLRPAGANPRGSSASVERGSRRLTSGSPAPKTSSSPRPSSAPSTLPPGLVKINPKMYQPVVDVPVDSDAHKIEAEEADVMEMEEGKAFRVVVRLRPLLPHEVENGDSLAVMPAEDACSVKFNQKALAVNTVSLTFDSCVSGDLTQVKLFSSSRTQLYILLDFSRTSSSKP